MAGFSVAVLGATGAVGHEFLRLFETRNFPVRELKLLASERSAGKKLTFQGEEITVRAVTPEEFEGVDFAFFSAGASRSREFLRPALDAGAVVIDNSSAFRMDESVPLIVPEVNGSTLKSTDRLVANPNCVAAILVVALAPLAKIGHIDRIIVSTYQSASGAGAAAMQELEDQTRAVLNGEPVVAKVMPHPYAFNLFSHNTPINEAGYNEEEWKVIQETQKIMGRPDLRMNVTCIRVPVMRAHSESVTVEFADRRPSLDEIRNAFGAAPGVILQDDRGGNHFPMPLDVSGKDEVSIGRLREDISNPNAISMFIAGDQLLKGAALNAVQIAEIHPAGMVAR